MKITIILSGVKTQKEIPTSHEEISFRTFLKLAPCGNDPVKILSVFTGIEEEIIRTSKIENLSKVIQMLLFLNQEIQYFLPKTIMGYAIPKDLEMETIAQYEDIKKELSTATTNIETIEKYPLLIASYCVKPYTWQEAEKLAPIFLDAPCTEVMAIGNFTLVKLIALRQNTKPHFRQVGTPLSRFKLVMTVWLKRLAFIIRYFLWRRKLRSLERNYLTGRSLNSTTI